MGLVGMLVCQEHRVDVIDIGVDQLLAQVGRGIDHDPRHAAISGPLDQQRAAAAAVFRIIWVAFSPTERGTRQRGLRIRSRGSSGSASCHSFRRRHFGEQPKEVFGGLARKSHREIRPRVSASTFATSTHVRRLVALAAKFAGCQIR